MAVPKTFLAATVITLAAALVMIRVAGSPRKRKPLQASILKSRRSTT
jgi:hypothetical protein